MAGEVHTQGLVKKFTASGAIAAYSIVKFGTSDGVVIQAAAAGDNLVGVTTRVAVQANDSCDVVLSGIASVKAAGTIARGAKVTTNAAGLAVAAAAGNNAIGIAHASAAAGDIIPVQIQPGIIVET